MKKFISFLISVTIIISALLFTVSAEAMPAYNSLNMYAEVNNDGSINVSEEWDITYFDSSDTKNFTRSFEQKTKTTDVSNLENFTDISNVSIVYDNKSYTPSKNDNTVTLSADKTDSGYSIISKIKSNENDLKFVINYTINGAVKLDGKNARLCYRAIDSQTGTVNNVTITVKYPETVTQNNIVINNGNLSQTINANSVTFTSDTVKETAVIDISVPSEIFKDARLTKYSALSDKIGVIAEKLLIIIPLIIVFAALILISFLSAKGTTLIKNKLKKEAEISDNDIKIPDNTTLSQCGKLLIEPAPAEKKKTKKHISGLFALGIADLIKSEFIKFNSQGEAILNIENFTSLPAHIQCIAELLMKYAEVINEVPTLNENSFNKLFRDMDKYTDYFFNLFTNYYSLIPTYTKKDFKTDNYSDNFISLVKFNKDTAENINISQIISLLSNDKNTDDKLILPLYKTSEDRFEPIEITCVKDEFANNISLTAKKIELLFN